MATCVTLNADGTLTPTGQTVDQCTGYVLVSGSEYGVYQVVQTAFSAPDPATACSWFVGTWGTVMFFYIIERAVGSVVSMFK
ncbi:MAG: hypothetical protein WA777_21045, partial [Rhodanobacter sp.]